MSDALLAGGHHGGVAGARLSPGAPPADNRRVISAERTVQRQGLARTAEALARWRADPWAPLRAWLLPSVAVAVLLLAAVWFVAERSTPDPTPLLVPGLDRPANLGDLLHVLARNGAVLALHAMACVAGFIAGFSMPRLAETRVGFSRVAHEWAGPLALGFVLLATVFSLLTQISALGQGAASLSAQMGVSPGQLLAALLPHALPELTALFLPLAAWTVASRRGRWDELLAAAGVTTAVAVPVLLVAAVVELKVSPVLLAALTT